MSPVRIHRRRTKGWRMPEGAVYVGRPSRWGNPIPVVGDWIPWAAVALGYRADLAGRRAAATALYRSWLMRQPVQRGDEMGDQSVLEYSDGSTATIGQHVEGFAAFVASHISAAPPVGDPPDVALLRGKDLVCWCPLDQPCHADVLLRVANV